MSTLHTRNRIRARQQHGALLIEVLVSMLIAAFALLGFAGMQMRSKSAQFESYQRSQALALVQDMTNRINANRLNAGDYVSAGLIGEGAAATCTSLTGAALDLCEWGNLIRGSTEVRGTSNVGSMISARGCISLASGTTHRYVVAVVWQGIVPTGAPPSSCGEGDDAFPTENLRRTASATVCVALLRDGDAPPTTPRC
jgi:type IV pilus assembly protein PilV